MSNKQKTIEAYNKNAKLIADKYDAQGARVSDIEEVFELAKKENPEVLEIGCGNGRDAKEIIKHTNNYLGIDISEELIKLAKGKVPGAKFEVADIEEFQFPNNLDVIIAFASLLHVNKESFKRILREAFESLNPDGLFRISLKHSETYKEIKTEDQFGVRTFYFYSEEDLKEILGDFKILKLETKNLQDQTWLEVILQK